ncbi:MAG: SpoIID/LytB domain-containing protein [Flavobacteriales bacterium]|nr:SpoIID/LytB domain-containing protein [Flavobacteriales bacterium]
MFARTLLTHALCLVLAAPLLAQERGVRIGLLRQKAVKNVLVMSAKGPCVLYADGQRIGELPANDGLRIEVSPGGISARSLAHVFTARRRIEVVPRLAEGGFRLRAPDLKIPEQNYPGTLEMTAANGALSLVNHVPLEAYTAGVVQSEAGNHHHVEYYKLQSVSCRTYALSNQRKHLPEGFELCDGTHCQVYHGRSRNDSILQAVAETRGLVLVDSEIRMIHATFHSNCGGETVNAEDVWSKSEPYLLATTDTFCLGAPQSAWEKVLTKGEWLGYLKRKHGFTSTDPESLKAVLEHEPGCRDLFLGNVRPLIPLKMVREDLKLRSTFFSIHTQGEQVVLRGRGFGHGVGLCQEGAMRMARAGRTYTEILHHYYTDVHLVDLTTIDFFRDEAPVTGPGGPSGR